MVKYFFMDLTIDHQTQHLNTVDTNGYVMTAKTNIQIRTATRDRLKTFGVMGDTYDDVLNTLMDNMSNTEATE